MTNMGRNSASSSASGAQSEENRLEAPDDPQAPRRDITNPEDMGVVGVEHGVPSWLVNDEMLGVVQLKGDAQIVLGLRKGSPKTYELTIGENVEAAPTAWVVEATDDEVDWQIVDERTEKAFAAPFQSRSFKIDWPEGAKVIRITLKQNKPAELVQVKVLAQ